MRTVLELCYNRVMISNTNNNEADILERIIVPAQPCLSPDAARSILSLSFSQMDRERMHELAEIAQAGTLSPDEQAELDSYERVGSLLGILQSKARISLNQTTIDQ